MAWLRATLILATTLAANKMEPLTGEPPQGTCASGGFMASCGPVDARVTPDHLILPLSGAAAVVLFTHAPTLFLKSRNRMKELWGGVGQEHGLAAALLASARLYGSQAGALAYAPAVQGAAL